MRHLLPLFLLSLVTTAFARSAVSESQVRGQILLTNETVPLDISARITLGGKHGYEQHGYIYGPRDRHDEYSFAFLDRVPNPGDYVLRLESTKYQFPSYSVRIASDDQVQVALFDDKTLTMVPGTWIPYPLVIRPLKLYPLDDLNEPPRMSLWQMLKHNPLIWLMAIGILLVLAIPKLMENLDEETLREVRESQKEMHANMASLQNFDASSFSKFLSGGGSASSTEEEELRARIEEPTPLKPQPKTNSKARKRK
ncbi:uncharacterized protein JCM15063_004692 [Sporobolomyces koalae]|uniref:uncharacterized protein n=1 Tax=Sporobolomyces koalae TaxID=500713 RepID=UPI003176DC58